MESTRITRRGGFTLIELLVVIAIIALLIGILLPSLGQARCSARSVRCIANMQQMAVAVNSYAAQYKEKFATFTWTANLYSPTDFAALQGPYADDYQAAARQAVDIMYRRGDQSLNPPIDGWIPYVLYNHLVIAEFLDVPLPSKMVVCPMDTFRLRWQDWRAFAQGLTQPQPGPGGSDWRWPFSSSYQFPPATYGPDKGTPANRTVVNAAVHWQYFLPNPPNKLGKRKITEVVNPGAKVMLYDQESRHCGKRNFYYAMPEAKQPLAFFDAHVAVYKTGTATGNAFERRGNEINPGMDPNNAGFSQPLSFNYNPRDWECPTHDGSAQESVIGYQQYCRGGLNGWDVGSREFDTRGW